VKKQHLKNKILNICEWIVDAKNGFSSRFSFSDFAIIGQVLSCKWNNDKMKELLVKFIYFIN